MEKQSHDESLNSNKRDRKSLKGVSRYLANGMDAI